MQKELCTFFPTQKHLRRWFEKNHKKEKELWVGFYKVSTGKSTVTWSQSVDEVLCFGWIDGIRKSIDEESYCIRFTPRKPTSNWSAINIKKVEELAKLGLMKPEGLKAFGFRKEEKSKIYAYENSEIVFNKSYEKFLGILSNNNSNLQKNNNTLGNARKARGNKIETTRRTNS